MTKYRSAPLLESTLPKGIPYIIGNEAAERFSFYGMRAVLVVFMTQYLVNATGQPDHMSADEAKGWFHLFALPYFTVRLNSSHKRIELCNAPHSSKRPISTHLIIFQTSPNNTY